MTGSEALASQVPVVDPAARRARHSAGEWQIWLGWMAAAILHGGLLAALILSAPVRLNPAPPDKAPLSLLIVAAEKPAKNPAIQPKPPGEQAVIPAAPPAQIANRPTAARPVRPTSSARAKLRLPQPKAVPAAPSEAVETKMAPQVGDGFIAAQPVSGNVNQPPEYPKAASDHGEQGDVLLSIHVLTNGVADSVSVTQSSGYGILDEAAANAAWKWRFQPSTLSGQPVPSVIPCRINFALDPSEADQENGAFCGPK